LNTPFAQWRDADIVALVEENPFAWIIATADPAIATPMPLLLETDGDGKPTTIIGHLPRAHPLVATLKAAPQTLLLFNGPHAYISPDYVPDRNWAPTWNFAIAKIMGETQFDDAFTDDALERLVSHMEQGRPAPWATNEMGARYAELRARVIGFRTTITGITARFKLGQDERPEVFDSIVHCLGDDPVTAWMHRFAS
jgi:transcriptional regulator